MDVSNIYTFFHRGFLSESFTNQRNAGERKGNSVTPHYHFHLLHRHVDFSRMIAAESSPLHISSSRTPTKNLWFPSAILGNMLIKKVRDLFIPCFQSKLNLSNVLKFLTSLAAGRKTSLSRS